MDIPDSSERGEILERPGADVARPFLRSVGENARNTGVEFNSFEEERLSREEETKLHARLDCIAIAVGQLLSTHGAWAEFVMTLLEDIQEGRERAVRVLTGKAAALARFEGYSVKLRERIREAIAKLGTAYYALCCEEQFLPFLEPGCETSPVSYTLAEDGALEITIDPTMRGVLEEAATGAALADLLDAYVRAQIEVKRLLYHVPMKPAYLLERLADFETQLHRYADMVEVYRTWQSELITAENPCFGEITAVTDEMHRKALWSAARGAGLFPADMLRLHDALEKLQKEVEAIQGRILVNARWVVRQAICSYREQAVGKGIDVEELFSSGVSHLAKLIKGFDWRKGARFSTWAFRDVLSHVRDTVAISGHAMRIPSEASRQADRVRAAYSRLRNENGVDPTAEEVAAATGLKVEACRSLMQISGPAISLQATAGDGGEDGTSMSELIADETAECAPTAMNAQDEVEILHAVWRKMPELPRLIIGWTYGIGGMPKLTQPAIAQRLKRPVSEIQVLLEDAQSILRQEVLRSPLAEGYGRQFIESVMQPPEEEE